MVRSNSVSNNIELLILGTVACIAIIVMVVSSLNLTDRTVTDETALAGQAFYQCSARQVQPCIDSDNGINFAVKGKTSGTFGWCYSPSATPVDHCRDSNNQRVTECSNCKLWEYYCDDIDGVEYLSFKIEPVNQCNDGAMVYEEEEVIVEEEEEEEVVYEEEEELVLRTASILELPTPDNFHCFLSENENLPECSGYYTSGHLVCPKYYNPVCGTDGLFYPTACWAEQLGTSVASYGHCDSLEQFISDLWLTKKRDGTSFSVPSPNIEFTYSGSGLQDWKTGSWLRSTLWKSSEGYSLMDFNIYTTQGEDMSTSTSHKTTLIPVTDNTPRALLVFVMFDEAYPEQVLLDWTATYEELVNDYISEKQTVSNPIQYELVSVVIPPPQDVDRPSIDHNTFSDNEIQAIYDAGTTAANSQDFEILIASPVFIDGFGGYFQWWNDMEFIDASLTPSEDYSNVDIKVGLDSLAAFQSTFGTISHEILHAVGLQGDHVPMGYGTKFLDSSRPNIDLITGEDLGGEIDPCEFLADSPDYYAVELPPELQIMVGAEPVELELQESPSGNCLSDLLDNVYLKDYDNDGQYEIMYKNNLIGVELQRTLGWVDIDGDGVAELDDSTAYGDWEELSSELVGEQPDITYILSTFESIEEVSFDGCDFERVNLETGQEGLVPLSCTEFNSDVVNIYEDVSYYWESVEKDYGTVFLARLS